MQGVDRTAREFAAILDSFGFAYAFIGGLAVRLHGLPRPTFDIDLTVAIARDRLPDLFAKAEEAGLIISEAQQSGWIDSVRSLPTIRFQSIQPGVIIDIDVFLAETKFLESAIHRRQQHCAEGLTTWFVSAEDLVLLKLMAGRRKDLVDVGDILLVQGTLDENYMRTWAARLGVTESLNLALREQTGE